LLIQRQNPDSMKLIRKSSIRFINSLRQNGGYEIN
jgi:hypothetical protein